ncbi:ENTH/VHS family protein [Striga asiatica]|uniref:ENTH/VHS family protein n=1 Tax=Striga asiatica TaxID=4170 RepID=A0A5A7P030_STRAF|nr:ENTH/VHS family protein [Striga asiatica]
MICKFLHQKGHNQRTCEWKKLVESGLQDGAFDMGAEAEEIKEMSSHLHPCFLKMVVASFDLLASFELGSWRQDGGTGISVQYGSRAGCRISSLRGDDGDSRDGKTEKREGEEMGR